MLYFDGISLNKYKNELLATLKGNSINKVTQTTDFVITLHFGKKQLVISVLPSFSFCYVTEIRESRLLNEERGFQLNLKKHLVGATLTSIEQSGFDRILIFEFSKLNELGEIKKYKIYFEMMGKHSNIILTTQDNKIIDSLKRFSLDNSKNNRVLFSGMEYELPVFEKKLLPNLVTKEIFEESLLNESLIHNIEGVGKYTADYISNFEEFQTILFGETKPTIFLSQDNEIVLATILPIKPKKFHSEVRFDTIGKMVDYYLEETNASTSFKVLQDKLLFSIKKEIKKVQKTISNIENEIEEKKDFSRYKEEGDILAASLYQIKKGMKEIELYDFYNNKPCLIKLDSKLYPQENLEKLYKKYSKTKKGLEFSKKRMIELSEQLKYLKQIEQFIYNSDSTEGLKGIEEELFSQNILKKSKDNKEKNRKSKTAVMSVPESKIGNVVVRYGRNNLENDFIIRNTNRENLWFHCKDISGAHVVLKENINLTEEELYNVALFCAKQTKISIGTKVVVEYTKIKNLNKPKGARPGFVTYSTANTIIVTVQ